ncbi:hypothetical protein K9M74_01350 [Candidatus Woesearchaeota archaeon]|nr:hypothetical protein [Candidatus Woesearchaeota archaeon]
MLFAEKPVSYYWDYFKLPFFIMLGWTVLGSILAFVDFATYQSIFTPLVGIIVQVLLFGFAGFTLYEDAKDATLGHATWSGALTGVSIGFISAVVSLILLFTLPAMSQVIVNQAAAKGVTLSASQIDMMKYLSFTSLISAPIVSGLLGAACGVVGGLVAKYFGTKNKKNK